MTSQPAQKISLSSLSDLKSTTDDFLAPHLTSLPPPYTFRQQHTLTNVRLILGYIAVTIAGVLFYVDYKTSWAVTKPYTLPACIVYFILNGILTYWIWFVEAGTVFVGTREGGQKLTLKSSVKKHDPTYRLHVTYSAPQTGKKWEDKEITTPFASIFNMHGYLDKPAFKRWLASNIEVVGLADPSSLQSGEKKMDEIADEIVVMGSGGLGEATGAETNATTPAKRGRPKKNKG